MTRSRLRAAPREANCDFAILTAYPEGHAEVASIDVEAYGATVFTRLADFQEHIRPYVCEAGGDAAVALANGYGVYIKATVLKRLPSRVGSPASLRAAPSSGCQHDSQCKGDRVCEAGRCVSP